MGEGEHTIISKIPRERLNQIASRKLSALGIPVRLGADRESLEGELTLSRAIHPATGQPIPRARFAVVGHDHLRFLDAPLSALGAVPFHEHERAAQLDQAITARLQERAAAVADVAARLRALLLDPRLDADRLSARAVVKTPSHAFELLGGPEGVRVSRVAPVGGAPFEVSPEFPPLDLGELRTPSALELHLVGAVGRMAPAAREGRPPAGPAAAGLEATPAPRNALTLAALAEVFGAESTLAPNAMVELVQEFQHGGTRYRFVATREMGTQFKGRLIGPSGDVWSDRFELAAFPGTRALVALALGLPPEPAAAASAGGAFTGRLALDHGEVPGHLQPHPGEIWVMSVVVEDAREGEVRYVGTDIDGRPYGAARVLPRADFEAVFSQERGGWRLLVLVDQVQDGSVIYRQLDRGRQPIGAPRKMAAAILVANFVPEAAAY
ncbi:hypothetical protein [Anaeromyxobacter sp. Fw109-5]|uniref:hypothetical protein n=1 Tax=Anaeromyxobacter sp. (strain Fw109-5) TaxID=404589 RepID=UPI0000ED7463|nr:hypothetical protein [Anaeromyxobacter sp. Fw109-5]ABS26363.1 conserved hypothetical protein [Anaeromyxobacter sp. Fw109-5]